MPLHLRDSHYKGAAKLGHGQGYVYPHDFEGHFTKQQYLPDALVRARAHYYRPTDIGREKTLGEYLHRCWPERY